MPQTKHLIAPVEFKDSEDGSGELVARFSTFDITDRDGDIVRASAFDDGQAVPMVWAHDWTIPIGKGVVKVKGDHAEFHGQFLSTATAQEARTAIREMGSLQQWSFGFRILDVQDNQQIRGLDITAAEIFEVSPVLVGANQETATLAVKSAHVEEDDDEARDPELVEIADEAHQLIQAEDVTGGLRRLSALVEAALKAQPESADQLIERERLELEALEIGEAA